MKEHTKKFRLRDLFHRAPQPIEEENTRVNLSSLKKMVSTKEQEDILKLIEHETIPSVRDAWVDYFLETTKRTKCKN